MGETVKWGIFFIMAFASLSILFGFVKAGLQQRKINKEAAKNAPEQVPAKAGKAGASKAGEQGAKEKEKKEKKPKKKEVKKPKRLGPEAADEAGAAVKDAADENAAGAKDPAAAASNGADAPDEK